MIMFEITQDDKAVFVNLDHVFSIVEDPEDENKTQLYLGNNLDGRMFEASEPVWELMDRVRAEIGK